MPSALLSGRDLWETMALSMYRTHTCPASWRRGFSSAGFRDVDEPDRNGETPYGPLLSDRRLLGPGALEHREWLEGKGADVKSTHCISTAGQRDMLPRLPSLEALQAFT